MLNAQLLCVAVSSLAAQCVSADVSSRYDVASTGVSECWTNAAVEEACCSRQHDLCGSVDQRTFISCCKRSQARSADVKRPHDCWTNLASDSDLLKNISADEVTLRPVDLSGFAQYFYSSGDALPALYMISSVLIRTGPPALDMCPSATVMAHLLELERSLHETPIPAMKARVRALRQVWYALLPKLFHGNMTHSHASALAEDVRVIASGFARLEDQLSELGALARARRKAGFEVQVVLPVCWPREAWNLNFLKDRVFVDAGLANVGTLFIYDVCYGFFPPGGAAYDLRNELECEVTSSSKTVCAFGGVSGKDSSLLPWPTLILELAHRFNKVVVVPFHEEIPMGVVSVIMRHVSVHYNRLPDVLLFLHPDTFEHVHMDALRTVFSTLSLRQWPAKMPYLSLGHRHNGPVHSSGRVASEVLSYCRPKIKRSAKLDLSREPWSVYSGAQHLVRVPGRYPGGFYCQWLELAWELLFDKPISLPEDDYGGYDFGQTAVTREAILRRPKHFWEQAWRALCTRSNYELLPGVKFVSYRVELNHNQVLLDSASKSWTGYHKAMECVFEHLWHVIFNPEKKTWLLPTRLRDPSVPLSFKFGLAALNPSMLKQYRWSAHDPL
eukprot:TRINITY_DN72037_c0_g1_i1.p1 TRINITY_DN72037_c0_g1~~TRINITY_DN72037_c0_g1_i1.p1  ORF type:complete len:614 (+),score=31.26 TRINITY_DN72037_c0_g1_i1:30-1871(+)